MKLLTEKYLLKNFLTCLELLKIPSQWFSTIWMEYKLSSIVFFRIMLSRFFGCSWELIGCSLLRVYKRKYLVLSKHSCETLKQTLLLTTTILIIGRLLGYFKEISLSKVFFCNVGMYYFNR